MIDVKRFYKYKVYITPVLIAIALIYTYKGIFIIYQTLYSYNDLNTQYSILLEESEELDFNLNKFKIKTSALKGGSKSNEILEWRIKDRLGLYNKDEIILNN